MSFRETYEYCEACVGTGLVFNADGDMEGCPTCETSGGLIVRTIIDKEPVRRSRPHPALNSEQRA